MEIERAWAQVPGWYLSQPPHTQTKLMAWALVKWAPAPASGSTKQGADWWTS